jgi:hypothetical protein
VAAQASDSLLIPSAPFIPILARWAWGGIMQAEWMGNLPEVTLRWAQNDVIGRFKEKAVEAEIHTNMAVAKAWNIRHLRFIEIPFRERAAASAATANPFGNQCGCAA